MGRKVQLVECPRDALQGCPRPIPTATKAELLRRLLAAGVRQLDCASFVSPRAVPQMADSEQVLAELGAVPTGTELIGIVLNARGAERAAATAVTTVGFPYSLSPAFQRRNANQTPEQARQILREIQQVARATGRKPIVYLSMAFGNPFGDDYSTAAVAEALAWLESLGIAEVSLADTVGLASAAQVGELVTAMRARFAGLTLGVHLHSRPEGAAEKVRAAFAAGCRRFDSALTGLGGCPFAGDALVGNIPTEVALRALAEAGAEVPLDAAALAPAATLLEGIRRDYCA